MNDFKSLNKFLRKLMAIICCTVLQFNTLASITSELNLTDEEAAALSKLGVGEEEINSDINSVAEIIDESTSEVAKDPSLENTEATEENTLDKLQEVGEYRKKELMRRANEEKKRITATVKNELIPGIALSSMSLLATALTAPAMLLLCRKRASALVYSGAAALYLAMELSSWGKYKLGTALALKKVEEFNLDEGATASSNIEDAKKYGVDQIDYFDTQLGLLKEGFEATKRKAKNAKMVSAGYAGAAATAIAEIYMDNPAHIASCSVASVDSNEVQFYVYDDKLDLSPEFSNAQNMALYQEKINYMRGENRSFTLAEYESFQILNETTEKKSFYKFLSSTFKMTAGLLVKDAFAITEKEEKMLNLSGDIDKLGVVVGGIISAGVAWAIYKGHLQSIKKLLEHGWTRAALFSANAGIAFIAGQKMEKAADILLERVDIVQRLLAKLKAYLNKGTVGLEFLDDLSELAEKLGIPLSKKPNEMSVGEIKDLLKEIDDKKENTLSDEDKKLISDIGSAIDFGAEDFNEDSILEAIEGGTDKIEDTPEVQEVQEGIDELEEKASDTQINLDTSFSPKNPVLKIGWAMGRLLINTSTAATCFRSRRNFDVKIDETCSCQKTKSCKTIKTPLLQNKNLNIINQYNRLLQKSANNFFYGNEKIIDKTLPLLEKNKVKLNKFSKAMQNSLNQKRVTKGLKPFEYDNYVKKITELSYKNSKKVYAQLSPEDRKSFGASMTLPKTKRTPKLKTPSKRILASLTKKEINILKNVKSKIADLMKKKNSRKSQFVSQVDTTEYVTNEIHQNKEVSIFKIIRSRYIKSAYPKLLNQ
jgi:hypothetical protein